MQTEIMAGYHGYSMSNNARAAKMSGRLPLSQAAPAVAKAHNVSVACAKAWFLSHEYTAVHGSNSEWHHFSKNYNVVYVFDTELTEEEVESLLTFRESFAPPKPASPLEIPHMAIKWVDFVKGQWGKYIPVEQEYAGPVTIKGKWVHFTFNGKATKKALDGNHIQTAPLLQWNGESQLYEP